MVIGSLENRGIWIELEKLREYLYSIVDKNGITSSEAIHASRVMDNKLNEYYRLQK